MVHIPHFINISCNGSGDISALALRMFNKCCHQLVKSNSSFDLQALRTNVSMALAEKP